MKEGDEGKNGKKRKPKNIQRREVGRRKGKERTERTGERK